MTRQRSIPRRTEMPHRLGLWLTLLVVAGLLFACAPAAGPAPADQEGAAPQSEAAAAGGCR